MYLGQNIFSNYGERVQRNFAVTTAEKISEGGKKERPRTIGWFEALSLAESVRD